MTIIRRMLLLWLAGTQGLQASENDVSPLPTGETLTERDRTYYEKITTACIYTNAAGRSMPYRLYVPEAAPGSGGYPLVLVFHGAGARGTDNLQQLKPWFAGWTDEILQKQYPSVVVIPQCPPGKRWVNQPWNRGSYSMAETPISEPMLLAREILDEVCRRYPVDRRRIYVVGASMGGYAAWYFAAAFPEIPAAVVAICGAGDPTTAERLKVIPIWAFHGGRDSTVPPSGSREMVEAIQRAGGTRVRLTMYPDVGHEAFKLAWKDPELIRWIFAQRR